jgi:hypothetical protein
LNASVEHHKLHEDEDIKEARESFQKELALKQEAAQKHMSYSPEEEKLVMNILKDEKPCELTDGTMNLEDFIRV